jgi:hypothetical protein
MEPQDPQVLVAQAQLVLLALLAQEIQAHKEPQVPLVHKAQQVMLALQVLLEQVVLQAILVPQVRLVQDQQALLALLVLHQLHLDPADQLVPPVLKAQLDHLEQLAPQEQVVLQEQQVLQAQEQLDQVVPQEQQVLQAVAVLRLPVI